VFEHFPANNINPALHSAISSMRMKYYTSTTEFNCGFEPLGKRREGFAEGKGRLRPIEQERKGP